MVCHALLGPRPIDNGPRDPRDCSAPSRALPTADAFHQPNPSTPRVVGVIRGPRAPNAVSSLAGERQARLLPSAAVVRKSLPRTPETAPTARSGTAPQSTSRPAGWDRPLLSLPLKRKPPPSHQLSAIEALTADVEAELALLRARLGDGLFVRCPNCGRDLRLDDVAAAWPLRGPTRPPFKTWLEPAPLAVSEQLQKVRQVSETASEPSLPDEENPTPARHDPIRKPGTQDCGTSGFAVSAEAQKQSRGGQSGRRISVEAAPPRTSVRELRRWWDLRGYGQASSGRSGV